MIRRLLLRLLPDDWRDGVDGDLEEDAGSHGPRTRLWVLATLAAIVLRFRLARWTEGRTGRWRLPVVRWAADARHDARYGLRRWLARPGFSSAAAATIALGIGTTAALFSVVDGVLLKPLPYPDPERLVSINRTYPDWTKDPILAAGWDRISLAYPEFFHVRARTRTLEDLAVITTRVEILGDDHPQELRAGVVSASFFPMLGAQPLLGSVFAPEDDLEDRRLVILSYPTWRDHFGADPGIIGREIPIRGGRRTVAGVMREDFAWGTRKLPYHLWVPLSTIPPAARADNDRYLDTIGRIRPGFSLAEVSDEMSVLLREGFRYNVATGGKATPLLERQLQSVRTPLLLLLGGAMLLLVIACANVAGLLLGDAASRHAEMAVRASLGASGSRLVRQLLVEALVLSSAGTAAGLAVAWWCIGALVALAPLDMPRISQIALDTRVVFVASVAAAGTAIVFALLPAFTARWRRSGLATGGSMRGATRQHRATAMLAVGEIAVAIALLAGAGLFARSLYALQSVDTGFTRTNLLTLRAGLPPGPNTDEERTSRFFRDARAALAALPSVTEAAITSNLPIANGRTSTTISLADPPPGRPASFDTHRRFVSPEYFRAAGIRLLSGRGFDSRDTPAAPRVALISREMEVRLWPDGAIGRTFTYRNAPHTVVGVVSDVRDVALTTEPRPTFYLSTTQEAAWPRMHFVVRTTGDPRALAASARAAIASVDPTVPVEEVQPMADVIAEATDDERYRAVLMGLFAAAAAVLGAVGLYNLLARRVAERRREIGVRLALGARPAQVRRQFLGEGLRLAALGIACGVPLALGVGRAAASVLFGVSPADTLTLAAVVLIVGVLAVLATDIPAGRASRLDAAEALRDS